MGISFGDGYMQIEISYKWASLLVVVCYRLGKKLVELFWNKETLFVVGVYWFFRMVV